MSKFNRLYKKVKKSISNTGTDQSYNDFLEYAKRHRVVIDFSNSSYIGISWDGGKSYEETTGDKTLDEVIKFIVGEIEYKKENTK
jgi:hypothetical protein